MSKRAWTYGDGCHAPLHKQPKIECDADEATNVGADYMNADGWLHVIEWLNWQGVKQLIATGNKLMRGRLARAVRHASINIRLDRKERAFTDAATDTSALKLLHDTHEGLHLHSYEANLYFNSRNVIHDVEIWNRIAPQLGSPLKASIRLDMYIIPNLQDYTIRIPTSVTSLSVILKDTSKRIALFPNAMRQACKITGCDALRHVNIAVIDLSTSSSNLTNFFDFDQRKIESISMPIVKNVLFSPFANLTELTLFDAGFEFEAQLPLSVSKLTICCDLDLDFVNLVLDILSTDNRIKILVAKYNDSHHTPMSACDHITKVSRIMPMLESYEIFRPVASIRLFAAVEREKGWEDDMASVLSNMQCLTQVPFELFDDNWERWCDVYAKLTESRRHQLKLSHGNWPVVNIRSKEENPTFMADAVTGALVKRWKVDETLTDDNRNINATMQRIDSEAVPPFSHSLHTIDFGVLTCFYSTAPPLTCLKSLPFLKTLSISVKVAAKGSTSAQTSVDHWVKQNIPTSLTSLSLYVYHRSLLDMQPFEDVGIQWLPPYLNTLKLTNVLPVKRMVDVLPFSVTSLELNGDWTAGDNIDNIEDVQLLDACDLYRMRNGIAWRKTLSLGLQFEGVQFEGLLKSFVYQMKGYHEWYNCPANLLAVSYHAEWTSGEKPALVHTIAC